MDQNDGGEKTLDERYKDEGEGRNGSSRGMVVVARKAVCWIAGDCYPERHCQRTPRAANCLSSWVCPTRWKSASGQFEDGARDAPK